MRPLAQDQEQVAFWQRHARQGVSLCLVLPVIAALRTLTSPDPRHETAVLVLAGVVVVTSPLVLLVPVERLVRHPRGRLFFDVWEALGVLLAVTFALLDGGAASPYVMCFYVLLAHAALAYPPVGVAIAGAGNVLGYLCVGLLGDPVPAPDLLAGSMTLVVATVTCAFASHNHVRAYRRITTYAQQLAVLAARDGLTGCLNHRTFHERVQAEAVIADGQHPLSLLLIDIDDFKRVNDTYGHPAGDRVLHLVGTTLTRLSRGADACGRLGGDEFALLLPSTPLGDATRTAERVRRQVREALADHAATVSIGVATTTSRADSAGLLAAADRAVYRAKRAGRDRVANADALLEAAH